MSGEGVPELDVRADGARVAVVAALWHRSITDALVVSATKAILDAGAVATVVRVPGAFELPLTAKRLAASGEFDAIVCLGAVIRGATAHFDYVAGQAAAGVARAALDTGVPIIFGVLTTENIEQAIERSGTKAGNKGFDSAVAAIEMADLLRQLPKGQGQ